MILEKRIDSSPKGQKNHLDHIVPPVYFCSSGIFIQTWIISSQTYTHDKEYHQEYLHNIHSTLPQK